MPLYKLIVVVILITIVASLGLALLRMIQDKGPSDRAVWALTLRVALSIGLFIFLMLGFATGFITPHGI